MGCEFDFIEDYLVRVEYFLNGGKIWYVLVFNCVLMLLVWCFDVDIFIIVYYGGIFKYWRWVIVFLDNVYICGYV